MKITFLYPLNQIEELKNEITQKETTLAKQKKEIDLLNSIIEKQDKHLIYLEDCSSKQSSEHMLYDEYQKYKYEYIKVNNDKLHIESEYRALLKEEVERTQRNKILNDKKKLLEESEINVNDEMNSVDFKSIESLDEAIKNKNSCIADLKESIYNEEIDYKKQMNFFIKEYNKLVDLCLKEEEKSNLKINRNGAKPKQNEIKKELLFTQATSKQYSNEKDFEKIEIRSSSLHKTANNGIKIVNDEKTFNYVPNLTTESTSKTIPISGSEHFIQNIKKSPKPPVHTKNSVQKRNIQIFTKDSSFLSESNPSERNKVNKINLPNVDKTRYNSMDGKKLKLDHL